MRQNCSHFRGFQSVSSDLTFVPKAMALCIDLLGSWRAFLEIFQIVVSLEFGICFYNKKLSTNKFKVFQSLSEFLAAVAAVKGVLHLDR